MKKNNWKKVIVSLLTAIFVLTGINVTTVRADEASGVTYGADIGWLSQLEEQGISWVDEQGMITDVLDLLKAKGIEAIRIRAFVNPPSSFQWTKEDGTTCYLGYTDSKGVLYTAQRADEMGMKIDLVIHYSDHFADPQYQNIPDQWKEASETELTKYVYDYTYYLMDELQKMNISPEWVEVGNEVNSGVLCPYGSSTENFEQLTEYLNSGYDAVKAVSPSSKVITHLAYMGTGYTDFTWFFDQFLEQYSGKTDAIGVSYYPYWVGKNNIEELTKILQVTAGKYNKEVVICETGGDENDPDGTYDLLRQEINALKSVPNNKGIAIFYWEPEAHSEMLPDGYTLGATQKVNDNMYKFTPALNAFNTGAEFLSDETSFEIQNYNSSLALNIKEGSWDNSAIVEQYAYGKWDSQKWYFEEVDSGYYKIINRLTGKVLEVSEMSLDQNAICTQYEYNGGWNQMWKLIQTSDGLYKIQNRLSGLFLGISDSAKNDGAVCVQLSNDDSNNLKWYLLVTE